MILDTYIMNMIMRKTSNLFFNQETVMGPKETEQPKIVWWSIQIKKCLKHKQINVFI